MEQSMAMKEAQWNYELNEMRRGGSDRAATEAAIAAEKAAQLARLEADQLRASDMIQEQMQATANRIGHQRLELEEAQAALESEKKTCREQLKMAQDEAARVRIELSNRQRALGINAPEEVSWGAREQGQDHWPVAENRKAEVLGQGPQVLEPHCGSQSRTRT